jgi:hypothetical protein
MWSGAPQPARSADQHGSEHTVQGSSKVSYARCAVQDGAAARRTSRSQPANICQPVHPLWSRGRLQHPGLDLDQAGDAGKSGPTGARYVHGSTSSSTVQHLLCSCRLPLTNRTFPQINSHPCRPTAQLLKVQDQAQDTPNEVYIIFKLCAYMQQETQLHPAPQPLTTNSQGPTTNHQQSTRAHNHQPPKGCTHQPAA